MQFSPRRGDLFPYTALAPPEGNKHKDNTANHEVFHDCSSLASWLDAVLPSLVLGGCGYKRKPLSLPLYYTPPEATDLDHILTILERILTSLVRIGPPRGI